MKGRVSVWLAAACVLTAAVAADEDLTVEEAFDMPLEELLTVSIATGTPRQLAEAPAIATVITAEEIRAMGATDLDHVLEAVPGLHVSRTHLAYNPQYVMRGLHSETSPYVLFLTNGIPMTLWGNGNVGEFWGGMPVAAISRIEIIRGPGSALFGADAVGGVVNIVTKTAAEIGGTEVGLRAGSFDTGEAWVVHGGQAAGFEVALALQLSATGGQREIVETDVQSSLDAIFGTRASRAPGPVSTGRDAVEANLDVARGDWRLRLGFQWRYDLGTGAGFIQALDPTGATDRDRQSADLTWRRAELTPSWDVEVQLSYVRDRGESDFRANPPGAFNGFNVLPDGNHLFIAQTQRQCRLGASATYTGSKRHRLRLGAGFQDILFDDIESRVTTDALGVLLPGGFQDVSDNPDLVIGVEQTRDVGFVFVQDEWRISEAWDLTAGVRWDHYSDFGDTVNPRLALVWKAGGRLTSKLLYGRAFRPPSYRELYVINNSEVLGNPDVEPEIMDTLELGMSYRPTPDSRFAVNVFAYELKDLILPVGRPARYRNVGKRTGEGFELEGHWTPGDRFELAGNYAYQQSTDEATGADAGHAPEQQLFIRTDWSFSQDWHLGAVLNAVAGRRRVFIDPREEIGDDLTVDVTLRREGIAGKLDCGLIVRNLFDEDVREPSLYVPGFPTRFIPGDLPQAGLGAFVELRFRL